MPKTKQLNILFRRKNKGKSQKGAPKQYGIRLKIDDCEDTGMYVYIQQGIFCKKAAHAMPTQ